MAAPFEERFDQKDQRNRRQNGRDTPAVGRFFGVLPVIDADIIDRPPDNPDAAGNQTEIEVGGLSDSRLYGSQFLVDLGDVQAGALRYRLRRIQPEAGAKSIAGRVQVALPRV